MLSRTDPNRFAQRFARIDFSGPVLAAVSGGSDSVALLVFLHRHLQRHHPDIALHAATVDHGLRAGSADEAQAVARFCAERGIKHAILRWTGDKPRTGLAAAAREARYRLLADAADAADAALILTGHTMDDQAETVAMRSARGEGRGQAGMAEATLYAARVWILRPFLKTGREALRRQLERSGIGWIDDPGNSNEHAERVRVRQGMTETDVERWSGLSEAEGLKRTALGEKAARLIDRSASSDGERVLVAHAPFAEGDTETRLYALRFLLAAIGGREHLPDHDRAAALLARLGGDTPFRATLGGVLITVRGEAITLGRETRGLQPPARGLRVSSPRFLPGFDLAPAAALARLFGAVEPPATPVIPHGDESA